MSSLTEITGTSIERATRSAVRWRVPVSLVGTFGLGTRWTLARAMRLASAARMMAPSILASSDRRWGLKTASSRNPPEQMLSTSGPSPTTTSAPILALTMRSSPSRRGVPGAAWASAACTAALRRAAIRRVLGRSHGTSLRHGGRARRRRGRRPRARPARARCRGDVVGGRRGHEGPAEPEPGRLGQPARRLADLAHLAAEADLAARHQRGRHRPAGERRRQRQARAEVGAGLDRGGRRRRPTRRRRTSPNGQPARSCSTARSMARRPGSMPWAERRGDGSWLPVTSAWTSTSSGRWPSMAATTAEPGTPQRRSARNRPLGSATPTSPVAVISNTPSSLVGPKRCFDRPQEPQGVVAVALEGQHRVDHVLEHAWPGQRAVLGDVADEHDGDAPRPRLLHEAVGALAHLHHRARRRGQVRVDHGLDRSRSPRRRAAPRRARRRCGAARSRPAATARGGGRRAARPGPAPGARPPRPRRRARAGRRPPGWPPWPAAAWTCRRRARRRAGVTEPGDEAAAEHPVELGQAGGHGPGPAAVDGGDGRRPAGGRGRRPSPPSRRRRSRPARLELLDEGVPRLARRAPPGPPGRARRRTPCTGGPSSPSPWGDPTEGVSHSEGIPSSADARGRRTAERRPSQGRGAAARSSPSGYPEAVEEFPWGERAIKVRKKVFALHAWPTATGLHLVDASCPTRRRFALVAARSPRPTGYGLGKSGWVSAALRAGPAAAGRPAVRLDRRELPGHRARRRWSSSCPEAAGGAPPRRRSSTTTSEDHRHQQRPP